jgi:hypothetical protein
MDILQTAIQAEGGVGKLADALGIRQNVVSNWRSRGLPKPWAHLLRLKYAPELAQAPATIAQAATENVATQGV